MLLFNIFGHWVNPTHITHLGKFGSEYSSKHDGGVIYLVGGKEIHTNQLPVELAKEINRIWEETLNG